MNIIGSSLLLNTPKTSRELTLGGSWNGKRYIAVFPYDATKMWASIDGKKWTKSKVNLDKNDRFQFVTSFNGNFVAFNDSITEENGDYKTYSAYYVSKDGVKWNEIPIPNKNPMDTFGDEGMMDGIKAYEKYIFVGSNGHIMYTKELKF